LAAAKIEAILTGDDSSLAAANCLSNSWYSQAPKSHPPTASRYAAIFVRRLI
jgi:hypothetical protein